MACQLGNNGRGGSWYDRRIRYLVCTRALRVDYPCGKYDRRTHRSDCRDGCQRNTGSYRLTRSASECGADACLLVTPYYNKPTQEGLYQHYAAVAESVDIPQILYNVPSRTACDMEPATVIRLAELPNIVGIKEASGDASRVEHILRECPEGFSVYSGDDATAMAFMQVGASGVISVTANIAPKTMATVCTHALAGEHEHARAEDANLRTLHHDLFIEPNPIPVKWLMHEAGLIDGGIRLPLTPLSEPHRAVLRDALHTTALKDEIATYHAH